METEPLSDPAHLWQGTRGELAKSQNQTRIDTRQTLIGSNLPSRLYFLCVRERSEKQDRSYDLL